MEKHHRISELFVLGFIIVTLLVGLFLQPFDVLLSGLAEIQTSTGILITDYMVVGGYGPTLVNGSLVGLIGYLLIKLNRVPMTGPTLSTIFLLIGFGYFGKNLWTILPIFLGVYLFSRVNKQEFKLYIYPALFGTALAPIVAELTYNSPFGLIGGLVVGTIAGFLLPPLANHLLKMHEGYSLYNVGLAAGFVGLFLVNLLRGYNFTPEGVSIWATEYDVISRWLFISLSVAMVLIGYFVNGRSFKGYKKILDAPGVLITDFIAIAGIGNTMINMGVVGLISIAYMELVNGSYNGATIGGILTVIGFGAFGKHPRNIIPIYIGVYLGTLFSTYNANDPGPMLAALFGTTLAPLAGKFGPIVGALAGFTHLSVVLYTGTLHGGLNLYNNGFAAGLVAAIFVAIINAFTDNE